MADYMITVKGFFTLAQDYEEECEAIRLADDDCEMGEIKKVREFQRIARRCRASAYKLLGAPTVDEDQRHMGEVMADF